MRYVNAENPDENIEIEVKKKKEDSHIFNDVVLVPFTKDGKICCHKLPYKSLNYYEFMQSSIHYDDIPTVLNSQ